ncbi:MAG: hypothetical protein H7312_14245 [Tardiphaga sp.]|nr:hypothetical protein [Tardiphaga sp.]
MMQDFELSRESDPAPRKFSNSSVMSGIMIALLDRNGKGGPTNNPVRRVAPASGYSARVRSYVVKRLRIVLMPLLHRLELRLRSAIEKTGLASNVFEVRTMVAGMQRKIDQLEQTCDDILGRLNDAPHAKDVEPRGDASKVAGVTTQPGRQLVNVTTSFGHLVVARSNPALLDFLLDSEALHLGTCSVIQEFLKPGDRFLSIGAGVGLLEMVAAKTLRDAGVVVVCEAGSEAAEAIRAAASINGLADTVRVHDFALAPAKTASASEDSDLESAELPLDTILAAGGKIALVKIEMEGYELTALRAIRRLQNDNPEMAVIVRLAASTLSRSGATLETWLKAVGELGFSARRIDDSAFAAHPFLASDFDHGRPVTLFLAQHSSRFVQRLVPAVGQP